MSLISSPVNLKFDPKTAESPVREIFLDDVTRVIWLGIKQRHVCTQYFNDGCLALSKRIFKEGLPNSPERLLDLLDRDFGHPTYGIDFARELFPYLLGEKRLDCVPLV